MKVTRTGDDEMRVTVVYESLMGNTRHVAEAVAAGIRDGDPAAETWVGPVTKVAPEQAGADLVVVGAPTHFFGLPRPRSRHLWIDERDSLTARRAPAPAIEVDPDARGIREWLDNLPAAGAGRAAAAFDTRLPRITSGAAARPIARRLRRLGYRMVAAPQGFVVEDMQGPVAVGELDRAHDWGAGLAVAMAARAAS